MTDGISSDDEFMLLIQSAIKMTRAYFESEFGIGVTEADHGCGDLDSMKLLDMTATVEIGAPFNLLVAMSFQEELLAALYERMTDGFDVQPDEVEMYRIAAAGDVVNTVIGHCTTDLQELNMSGISLTPPIVLDSENTIQPIENGMFYRQSLDTEFGRMDINLVGRREQLSAAMDHVK